MVISRFTLAGFLSLLLISSLPAQEAANYPTAGGGGGTVMTVTTLEDGGPGSLREALSANGPRVIKFAVGGEIWLKDKLPISSPFVTVDGSSAPSPGITLMGDRVRLRTHDVILRDIRVRVGALLTASDPQSRDGISIDGAEDGSDPAYGILVENCSVSWAIDENMEIWGKNNHDIVVRNCIIAEGLQHSIHPKGGQHSAGIVMSPYITHILIQGNLFASNVYRNPVVSAGSDEVILNNVIYNPSYSGFHIYGRFDHPEVKALVTVVGNVLIAGPNTKPALSIFHEKGLNVGSQIYLKDNIAIGTKSWDETSRPPGWPADAASPFVQTPPVPIPAGVKVLPSNEVEASVLAHAGARPEDRDAVDQRLVSEVTSRTGSIKDAPTDPRLCPQAAAEVTGVWADYAKLLKKYVKADGVRYGDWKTNAEDMAALQRTVDFVASAKQDDLPFYLNAYNAWVLHEVLKQYPLKSVHDPALQFYSGKHLKVGGSEMSLDDLEKIIADHFHDPRTLFALNWASRGGPDVCPDAFIPETIKAQLDRLAGFYVNSDRGVKVGQDKVAISEIFDWRKNEFPKGATGFISTYRNKHIPNLPITLLNYDWNLNEAK